MDKKFDQSDDFKVKRDRSPSYDQGFDLQAQINAMVGGKSTEEIKEPENDLPPFPKKEEPVFRPAQERAPRPRPQPRVRRSAQAEDFIPSRENQGEPHPTLRRVPQNRREAGSFRSPEGRRGNRRTYRRSQGLEQRANRWKIEDPAYDPLMEGFDQKERRTQIPEDVCETMPKELGKRIPGLGIPSAEFTAADQPQEIPDRKLREPDNSFSGENLQKPQANKPSFEPVEIPKRDRFHAYYPEDQIPAEKAIQEEAEGDWEDRSFIEEDNSPMPDDVCETMPKELGKRIPGLGIPSAKETAADRPEEIWEENMGPEEEEGPAISPEEAASQIQRKRPSAIRRKKIKAPVQEAQEEKPELIFEEEEEAEEPEKKGFFHRKKKEKPEKKRKLAPVDKDATENLSPLLMDRPQGNLEAEEDATRKIDRREIRRIKSEEDLDYDEDLEDDEEEIEEEEEKPTGFKRFVKEWLEPVIIAVALAMIINVFLGGATLVKGESMEPTLHNKEVLIVSKIPAYTGKFQRSDIVILDSPDKKDEYYVKRIIGLPGEKVDIVDGRVFINEKLLKEYYIGDLPTEIYQDSTWKLGDDEYFVMGDNRKPGASNDSRLFGPVKRTALEEVARFRIFPFSKIRSFY